MKVKVIWSKDTAQKVADEKSVKYGSEYIVVPAPGGGFTVQSAQVKAFANEFREVYGREDLTDEHHVGMN